MASQALNAAAARAASRRASRLARELSAAVGQVADQLDADLIAVHELSHDVGPEPIQDLLDLVFEATENGPVTITITRPNHATTAP